jgi:Secretion system C-terminal sorting domain
MKKLSLSIALFLLCYPLSISAQNNQQFGTDGTSDDTYQINFKNMMSLREKYPVVLMTRAINYVPVCFHLVAKDDGSGRVLETAVLDVLCQLNNYYQLKNIGIQFFIKNDFNYINNSSVYDQPITFYSQNILSQQKKSDALNIFIVNTINRPIPGQTLAVYSNRTTPTATPYSDDWMLMIKSEVHPAKVVTLTRLTCEFFGLVHTAFGSECLGYVIDTTICYASKNCNPKPDRELERVARTGARANCNTAGDGFCDTPADYGPNGFIVATGTPCTYNNKIKDEDCVLLMPDRDNIMSYFSSCGSNITNEQINALRNNYTNLPQRKYLRDGNQVPYTNELALPKIVSPSSGSTTAYANSVDLDWDDVEGAIGYIIEVSTSVLLNPSVTVFINNKTSNLRLNSSNITNQNLLIPYRTLYWRVRAYGSYKTCTAVSSVTSFTTGTDILSSNQDIEGVENISLSPIPLSKSSVLSINVSSLKAFDAKIKIFDVTGRLLRTENRHFDLGNTSQNIAVSDLINGLYVLKIESEKGSMERRFVVQD